METVDVVVKLPKESVELAKGIEKFLLTMAAHLKDGFQVGDEIPAGIQSAMMDLVPALDGATKIAGEAKLDPVGVGQAFAMSGVAVARELAKKPEVAAEVPAEAPAAEPVA